MQILIAGLLIFMAVHSVRIFADDWRESQIERIGKRRWTMIYTFHSLFGLVLIVWGYGLAREAPVVLWDPPLWGRHLALLLMAVSFFLFAQSGGPQGPIVARIGHPMMAATGIWGVAHLSANGTLADLLLFGSFVAWAVLAFRAAVQRDRAAGIVREPAGWMADIGPGLAGLGLWAIFVWKVHAFLFGVSPLG
ncbi:MAG TPA: NnrU family protein [Afifellaceae bacterium]|nr:NnrU family protein [Afifellaceae bacterium]